MSEDKQQNKGLRDFLIGAGAGAGTAVFGLPFDRLTDPITSRGYHDAMKLVLPGKFKMTDVRPSYKDRIVTSGGQKIVNRKYHEFARDQLLDLVKKNPLTGVKPGLEWSSVGVNALKKGVQYGAATLITGALYRLLKDKQPVEKHAEFIMRRSQNWNLTKS